MDRAKYLDGDEVRQLMDSARQWAAEDMEHHIIDLRWPRGLHHGACVTAWAFVDTALRTGLRVAELARLTVGDVDLDRGLLRVWRLKRRQPIHESLAISRELLEHLKEFLIWKASAAQSLEVDGALFVGKRGPYTIAGLKELWYSAIERAGLPKGLSIHCARHTVAFHLLRKTGNLRLVQKQLGHANPATTANMYADVSFEDMQEAGNGLYGEAG